MGGCFSWFCCCLRTGGRTEEEHGLDNPLLSDETPEQVRSKRYGATGNSSGPSTGGLKQAKDKQEPPPSSDSHSAAHKVIKREASSARRKPRKQSRKVRQSPEATAARDFLERKVYEWIEPLPVMGCRLHKFWAHLGPASLGGAVDVYEDLLLTVMPLSSSCLLQLEDAYTQRKLNELLEQLKKHPYIHPILEVEYLSDSKHVAVVQPYIRQGSLKDLLGKCAPDDEWDKKYGRMNSLPPDKIARYGRHILEALLFLYNLPKRKDRKTLKIMLTPGAKVEGFSPLGQVHSGNVFVEGDVCKLGGYENALLAYKTRQGKLFRNHQDDIDVLMFGHLVFEMACGYSLSTTVPTGGDLSNVKHPEVCKVLNFIFDQRKSGSFPTIEEVRYHKFFNKDELVRDLQYGVSQVAVSNGMLKLLERTQYLVH